MRVELFLLGMCAVYWVILILCCEIFVNFAAKASCAKIFYAKREERHAASHAKIYMCTYCA